jgi:arylamine N-acetyltransferase
VERKIKHVAPWLAATGIGGALVFAPVASAPPGHVAPPSPAHAPQSQSQSQTQSQSGADPFVPNGAWAPGDLVPYDPFIKNPGGGVDLAS